jgi:7-cyano-7-deazaguanine reductase
MEPTLEELYGITKKEVELKRVRTLSGKYLEIFKSPGNVLVSIDFPEFTCLCPKTSHPDFANIKLIYIPDDWCVELKAYKYYLNSFRNEGHFHEQVIVLIERDLRDALTPVRLFVQGRFNVRGGTEPVIECGDQDRGPWDS